MAGQVKTVLFSEQVQAVGPMKVVSNLTPGFVFMKIHSAINLYNKYLLRHKNLLAHGT